MTASEKGAEIFGKLVERRVAQQFFAKSTEAAYPAHL